MATYRAVSSDIAERVASGALAAGTRLPSVREAARQYETTPTTIGRAYRNLADAGVIDVADRRRAQVAAGGDAAARRALAGTAALRLAGSDDPALDIVLRDAGDAVLTVGERGSFHGLTRLWRGTAEAAAIHLQHRGGEQNSPFARTVLRGRQPAVIHLWRREQGILTYPGNPLNLAGPGDLRSLRVARRPFGTGTRVLLDRLLTEAGVLPASVTGPEAATHLEVAMAIACGQADAGLGVRAAAAALDLGFVPVTWESFEIVLSADALPAAEPLIAALREGSVQSSVGVLGGYDVTRSGMVQLID
jgi:molybdate-binding protein